MVLVEEAGTRKHLNHRNIVTLLGVCMKSQPNFILDEYFPLDMKKFMQQMAPIGTDQAGVSVAQQLGMYGIVWCRIVCIIWFGIVSYTQLRAEGLKLCFVNSNGLFVIIFEGR